MNAVMEQAPNGLALRCTEVRNGPATLAVATPTVRCPTEDCGRGGPGVSGEWTGTLTLRWRCHKCREMVEAEARRG